MDDGELFDKIYAKAKVDPQFRDALFEISELQRLLDPFGPLSTSQLAHVASTPEWAKRYQHYQNLCREVARAVVSSDSEADGLAGKLMFDVRLIAAIAGRFRKRRGKSGQSNDTTPGLPSGDARRNRGIARSILAVAVGYLAWIPVAILMSIAVDLLFPGLFTLGKSSFFYNTGDLLWLSAVWGIPAVVSGYLTARLATRAPMAHVLAVACPVMVLMVVVGGPSFFLSALIYILNTTLSSSSPWMAILDALSDLKLVPLTVAVLIWSPSIVVGGLVRRIEAGVKGRLTD